MWIELIPQALAAGTGANASVVGAGAEGDGLTGLLSFLTSHLPGWIGGIVILVVFFGLAKVISQRAKEKIISSKGEDAPENILVLVERLSKIGVMAVGIIIAGAVNGLNVATMIGAISLGIGFALKDIIGNMISSIVMLAQNRIRIGDFVKVGDILGTIMSIDTRVTIIQAMDGSQVIVPNQAMLNQVLISYTTNPFRRIQLDISVYYEADLALVTSLVKGVVDKHPDVVPKPASNVIVSEFDDSGIGLTIFFWIESKKPWQQIRTNVAYRVNKALNEAGIEMPYPIRTLKIDEDDRAFLKTMDSLKKGIVPEVAKNPTPETLRHVAEVSESDPTIPEKLFEEKPLEPQPDLETAPSIEVFKEREYAAANPGGPGVPPPTHI